MLQLSEYTKELSKLFSTSGNILLVSGRVKLRGDRLQLVCEHVHRYQIDEANEEGVVTAHPVEIQPEVEEIDVKPSEHNRLVISLKQTGNEAGDIANLHKIINVLRDFPGRDNVNLVVDNEKKVFKLRLSNIHVEYCPALHQRLVELVGEDKVQLRNMSE